MPNIAELAAAVNDLTKQQALKRNHSILIYGDPKEGKTRLGATIAKVPSVRQVHWFDAENGSDTIIAMVRDGILSMEQAAKITLYKMFDIPSHPVSFDTILKSIVVAKPVKLCVPHGRVNCPACLSLKDKGSWQEFDVNKLTKDDWVVVDSGTTIAHSAMMYLMKGSNYESKPGWDEFGPQGRMLMDILTVMQSAVPCNYMLITHKLIMEEKDVEKKLLQERTAEKLYSGIFPQMGSKNFSLTIAKYFGHIIYCHRKLGKHVAGSSTTYNEEILAGSRTGMRIEDAASADLSLVFDKLGLAAPALPTK